MPADGDAHAGLEDTLAGVRVLDFTQNLPGPYATMVLSSMGADVVKVEPPSGDPARLSRRLFELVNAGKRSVVVDLKDRAGIDAVHSLMRWADVVVEGFRPGVMARLGCGPDEVLAINPSIVYCSISGYGHAGGDADPGHDLNFQALTGVCDMHRDADGRPHGSALPLADLSSALTATTAIVAAWASAQRTGRGRVIDVAMTDTVSSWAHVWSQGLLPSDARPSTFTARWARRLESSGAPTLARLVGSAGLGRQLDRVGHRLRQSAVVRRLTRLGLHVLPHYGLFQTADGQWLSIAIVEETKFWRELCVRVGLPRLANVPLAARVAGHQPIRAALARAIRRLPLEQWLRRLDPAVLPIAPVLRVDQAAGHPGLVARVREIGGPPRVPGPLGAAHYGPVPKLGEHTHAVLAEIVE